MIDYILTIILFTPIIGALLVAFVPKQQQQAIRAVAITTTLVFTALCIWLWQAFDRQLSGMQFVESYRWFDIGIIEFRYDLGVDGLSLPMLVLTAIVTCLAVVASYSIKQGIKEYYLWVLVLQTGMAGVFVALDMLLFFMFFELTLIPMFFIIGIWGSQNREYAAFKFLVYTGLGSIVMLLGFFGLFYYGAMASGFNVTSFNMMVIAELFALPMAGELVSEAVRTTLFVIIFVAFAVKLPIFPFHTWLPDAHVQAPTPASMILAGVLLKMGAYGLIRIGYGILPDIAAKFATVIAILGVINILYGAMLALVQKDLKKLVAYSSISHMGIVLLGIASWTAQGMQGAIFQMVSHGFISALLFFMVGAIYERTHTRMIADLGGLSRSVPVLAGFFLAAAMASVGLPGLSGFVSELLAFMGLFAADSNIIAAATLIGVIAALGIILTAAYLLWAVQGTIFGTMPEQYSALGDARRIEYVPMIALFGLSLLLGVYPAILADVINVTVIDIIMKVGG